MEYELRMRVHFACELLLVDLTGTLSEISGATIDAITERWVRTDASSPAVRDVLGFTEPDPSLTLAENMEGNELPREWQKPSRRLANGGDSARKRGRRKKGRC